MQNFEDFLALSKQQAEPQRLLLVFSKAELNPDATELEKEGFEKGEGGHLTPTVCVDKSPDEVGSFENLNQQAIKMGNEWDVAFMTTLSGKNGIAPTTEDAEQPLYDIIHAVQNGQVQNFLAMDNTGKLISLS
jgi:hypothetical protein